MITAGGRLSPGLAAACGTTIKALAPLGNTNFIGCVTAGLRESGAVSAIGVVGPVSDLKASGVAADVWVEEGATGPENIRRGICGLRDAGLLREDESVLLCATDAVFLRGDTVKALIAAAETNPDADIVFPIVRRETFEAQFPDSPNVYVRLKEGAFTGSSAQIVKPSAIERCQPYIEKAFAARKSQWEMARLLGWGFVWRFLTRTLSVADAVAKIAAVTGLNCSTPVFPDAGIAIDVDTAADYEYAKKITARTGAAGTSCVSTSDSQRKI